MSERRFQIIGYAPLAILSFCIVCCTSYYNIHNPSDEVILRVHCKLGFKNELNTFAGTYQKDLVQAGTVTIPFSLTLHEQDSILQKALDFDFCSFPDTIPMDPEVIAIQPDPGPGMLRLQYAGCDKVVVWFYPRDPGNEYTKPLEDLYEQIWRVVEGKEEYRKLPEEVGGYE
jgi:hypothetical protein